VSGAGAVKFEVLNHCAGVRPPEGAALGVGSRNQIREAAGPDALAAAGANRIRLAGVQGENSIDLPMADYFVRHLVHGVAELLATAEGKVVG
jgi:hypothetical protein